MPIATLEERSSRMPEYAERGLAKRQLLQIALTRNFKS